MTKLEAIVHGVAQDLETVDAQLLVIRKRSERRRRFLLQRLQRLLHGQLEQVWWGLTGGLLKPVSFQH
jgi:hypothetical protein